MKQAAMPKVLVHSPLPLWPVVLLFLASPGIAPGRAQMVAGSGMEVFAKSIIGFCSL
jgi:hypothetical protein